MKYYYTPDTEYPDWFTSGGQRITHFLITPADYYDKKGFLSDNYRAVPPEHLPRGFVRCADSKFEFRGSQAEGLEILQAAKGFIQRDMVKEIAELYEHRRDVEAALK
jgi:hypothetical protein